MTRHDVWDVPVVPWFMDRMRHIPVNRQAPAYAYLRARRLLARGRGGGRLPGGRDLLLLHGAAADARASSSLARETGAPVVPVAIWGTQRIFSVGDPDAAARPDPAGGGSTSPSAPRCTSRPGTT